MCLAPTGEFASASADLLMLPQAIKLDEAAQMLQDKENLEEAVRRQHDLIEKQTEELRSLKKQLEEREGQLEKAKWVAGAPGKQRPGCARNAVRRDEPHLGK